MDLDQCLDIGEVVRRSGVSDSALRFYERKALIAPVGRLGLRRQYSAEVLDRLALIAAGREAGFTLAEIQGLLDADERSGEVRGELLHQADAIELRIARLANVRDGLRHAAACTAPRLLECPLFLAEIRRAGGATS
jgi:DNA-binding transcriptional MerR regulator